MEENAVWNYAAPLEGAVDVRDYVAFYWNKMDAWYEEDEEVFVHAKDPYKRVECIRSSRHVAVVVNGEAVAETDRPVLVLETGSPERYYIPKNDVRQDLLTPSEKVTRTPYKGVAHYHSVTAGEGTLADLAWYYRYPTPEAAKIAGHLCFPQELVEVLVDGELLGGA